MTTSRFSESTVEQAALAWLEALGYSILHGPDIAFDQPNPERTDPNYRDVVLAERARTGLNSSEFWATDALSDTESIH